MRLRAHDAVAKEPVAVAGTRAPSMALVGVPYWYLIGALGVASVPMWFYPHPALFAGVLVVAVVASRLALAGNPNRPREYLLAATSGSLWAARGPWGGERTDPLARRRPEARP